RALLQGASRGKVRAALLPGLRQTSPAPRAGVPVLLRRAPGVAPGERARTHLELDRSAQGLVSGLCRGHPVQRRAGGARRGSAPDRQRGRNLKREFESRSTGRDRVRRAYPAFPADRVTGLMILENVLQGLTAGLLIGSVYALMCVGLGLIFGVMRVINFAQGEFLMLGMYGTLYAYTWLALGSFLGPYVGPIVGALLAAVVIYFASILLHRYLLVRVTGSRVAGSEGEGHYPQLILTLGLSLIIANAGLIFFGSTPENIRTPLSASAWEISVSEQVS